MKNYLKINNLIIKLKDFNKDYVFAGIAQSVEQLICNQPVGGSIPLASSIFSNIQSGSIFAKPLLVFRVGWQHLVHFVPEGVGMVGVMEVAKFVNDDVVDNRLWRHHALPVKRQLAARIT